jgi:3,4-dihydroxy 2-butanone 4-phosphate synthase/GTP cyclohydrolase II
MRPDGEMARLPDLEQFCARHSIKMCSVAQIIEYRLGRESLVRRLDPIEGQLLRTAFGDFKAYLFDSVVDPLPHLVLTKGGVGELGPSGEHGQLVPRLDDRPTLVRMHRRHLLGDVFDDLDSTPSGASGEVLRGAMRAIEKEGRGAVVYLRPSLAPQGRTTDLETRLQTLLTRRSDQDTPDLHGLAAQNAVPMLQREFGIGGQILRGLGLRKLRLLTNHPRAMPGLDAFGIEIVEHVPIGASKP